LGRGRKILCTECGTPVAEIIGDVLVIKVKHHGEQHATIIPIEELQKLAVDKVMARC